MGKAKELVGLTFTRLTVIERAGSTKLGTAKWKCQCECGKVTFVTTDSLTMGKSKSCGCLCRDLVAVRAFKHGLCSRKYRHPLYMRWAQMIQRCTNSNSSEYYLYGAKGVKVCERWRNSFTDFLTDMGERPTGTTLDRWPDPNGDYKPGNVRWATTEEQQNNKRDSRFLTHDGKTLTIAQWSRLIGLSQKTIAYRLNHGMSDSDTLTIPPNGYPRNSYKV